MSIETAALTEPQFSVGRVLSKSLEIFGRNFATFFALAALFMIPTLLVEWFFNPAFSDDLAQIAAASEGGSAGYEALSNIVNLICSGLVSGALVFGTFQDLRGQKARFGDCLSRALSVLVWVAVGAIAYGFIVGLGTLLLVIPGIIFMVIYWLYAPAIVVEKAGPFSALGRSAHLTKGRRWHVFGLLLAIFLASLVFFFLTSMILGAVGGTLILWGGATVMAFGLYIVLALISAYSAVANTVAYYYLRADKEGIEVEDIAKVFD